VHGHRTDARAWLLQRASYGSSAGPLARRHPGRLAHLVLPAWSAVPWGLALCGRPRAAIGIALAMTGVWVAGLPRAPGLRPHALTLAGRAHVEVSGQLAAALWRAYPPLVLAAALTSRRGRALVTVAAALPALVEWSRRRPALDPLRYTGLRVLDDLAYASGLWLGCLRSRTLDPLLPRLAASGGAGRWRGARRRAR
jgi:hypothetical protein